MIIWPTKVNLTFNTVPSGLTFYLDGIAHTTPFVYDDLVGFNHTIEARNQQVGSMAYTFSSWSDGGAQTHNIVVPNTDAPYTATYTASQITTPPAFVQGTAREVSGGTANSVLFTQPNGAGNLIVAFVVWDNSSAVTLTDSNGNTYAAATARTAWGSGWSAQTFYAKNVARDQHRDRVVRDGHHIVRDRVHP